MECHSASRDVNNFGTPRNLTEMPYKLRKTRRGCQVVGKKGKRYSRKPIKCKNAEKQLRLLRAIEHKGFSRARKYPYRRQGHAPGEHGWKPRTRKMRSYR
jgi:hypothetical protein